jgi:hypothetical protein
MNTGTVILIILAAIIVGAIVTSLKKSKTPENKGGDVEPGNGDLGTGNGRNK